MLRCTTNVARWTVNDFHVQFFHLNFRPARSVDYNNDSDDNSNNNLLFEHGKTSSHRSFGNDLYLLERLPPTRLGSSDLSHPPDLSDNQERVSWRTPTTAIAIAGIWLMIMLIVQVVV